MGHKPSDEDAGEEAHDRQEQLAGNEIEEVEHRHAEELVVVPGSQREGTYDTHNNTADGHHQGSPFTGGTHLLLKEGCAHLMEGDERCECGHRQQGIEEHGDDIT